MSTSIRGVVEYFDINTPLVRWDLGEVFFPSTYTDIQELLGMWEPKDSMVPARGFPKDNPSSGANAIFTALVIRGSALDHGTEFDSNGQCQQGDGMVLNEVGADRWLAVGSEWLDDETEGWTYRRLSDPDMRGVNWITREEYEKVVDEAERRAGSGRYLSTHRAVLAAMKSLEDSGHEGVRFVYGGS